MNAPSLETLRDLDDVELLHGVDEIVTQFEELDPHEAGDALGALIQEFGERHSPDAVLAQFRRLLLARDQENDPALERRHPQGDGTAGSSQGPASSRG